MQTDIKPENRFRLDGYLTFHKALINDITAFTKRTAGYTSASNQDLRKMEQWFTLHCYMINGHHTLEDDVQFPQYARRDANFSAEMQKLGADHQEIEALIAQITHNFNSLLAKPLQGRETAYSRLISLVAAYGTAVSEHLAREEAAVIKSVRRHFTEEEQLKLEKDYLKSESLKHLSISAPWMVMNLNPLDRAELFRKAPFILKVLYYLSWKKKYLKAMPVFDN